MNAVASAGLELPVSRWNLLAVLIPALTILAIAAFGIAIAVVLAPSLIRPAFGVFTSPAHRDAVLPTLGLLAIYSSFFLEFALAFMAGIALLRGRAWGWFAGIGLLLAGVAYSYPLFVVRGGLYERMTGAISEFSILGLPLLLPWSLRYTRIRSYPRRRGFGWTLVAVFLCFLTVHSFEAMQSLQYALKHP